MFDDAGAMTPHLEEDRRGGVLRLVPAAELAEAVGVDPVAVAVEEVGERVVRSRSQFLDQLRLGPARSRHGLPRCVHTPSCPVGREGSRLVEVSPLSDPASWCGGSSCQGRGSVLSSE